MGNAETPRPAGRRSSPARAAAAPVATLWSLEDLRPTQMTVGLREVERKRQRLRAPLESADRELWNRPVPVVLGPAGRAYALDRHHTLCALRQEGMTAVAVAVVSDLSRFDEIGFWREMQDRGWCHPVDDKGVRTSCKAMPTRFEDLSDDPFRSLASALRRSGGYAKSVGLYSEFGWAAYLRRHLAVEQVRRDFPSALRAAQVLARAPGARTLPGALEPLVTAQSVSPVRTPQRVVGPPQGRRATPHSAPLTGPRRGKADSERGDRRPKPCARGVAVL